MHPSIKEFIVGYIAAKTRTFGGGKGSQFNPIAEALKDQKPQFAAGVDVGEVVDLVFEAIEEAKKTVKEADEALASM